MAAAAANLPASLKTFASRSSRARRPPTGADRRFAPALLAGLSAIAVFAIDVRAAAGGSRDYDEGVYWLTLRSLAAGHHLYSEIFAAQGPVFFYGLLPVYAAGHSIAAARVGVAIFSVIASAAMFVAVSALAGRWAALASVVLLLTDPIWSGEALTLHAEVPSLALGLVALALTIVASLEVRRPEWLAAGSGAVLGLAVASKAFAILFVVPIVLYLVMSRSPARWRNLLVGFAGFVITTLVVFLPFFGDLRLVYQDLVGLRFGAAHASNAGIGANLHLLHLGRELPLELAAIALAMLALIRGHRAVIPAAAWVILSGIALLVYQPLFPHELALLTVPLAFLAGVALPGLAAPAGSAGNRRALEAAAAVGLLLIAGLAGARDLQAWRAATAMDPHEQELAATIASHTAPSDLIIGDNPYSIGLAGRGSPPALVDTSFARIVSRTLTAQTIQEVAGGGDVTAFVFDTGRLDAVPGLRAWVAGRYPVMEKVGKGTVYLLPR